MGISEELYNLLENYLSGRLQRVILNGQTSSQRPILAGVPPRVNIVSTTFSHLHKRSTQRIKSNAKFFADDASHFTIVKYVNEKANALNNDLSLISNWAFNWKMLFNPDPTKPAQKILFSKKRQLKIIRH